MVNSNLAPGSTYPAMTDGPFGVVWMVGDGANNLSTIDTSGRQSVIDSGTNDDRDIVGSSGSLLVSDAAGLLLRYTPVNAHKTRTSYLDTPAGVLPEALASDGARVWLSSTTGRLYSMSGAGKVNGPFGATQTGFPHSILVVKGRLYAASGSTIVSVSALNGSGLRTYRAPSGARLTSLARGADGDIWFPEAGINRIGRLNLRTRRIVSYRMPAGYRLPSASAALTGSAIAPGARKTIWFTALRVGAAPRAAVGEITGLANRPR